MKQYSLSQDQVEWLQKQAAENQAQQYQLQATPANPSGGAGFSMSPQSAVTQGPSAPGGAPASPDASGSGDMTGSMVGGLTQLGGGLMGNAAAKKAAAEERRFKGEQAAFQNQIASSKQGTIGQQEAFSRLMNSYQHSLQ